VVERGHVVALGAERDRGYPGKLIGHVVGVRDLRSRTPGGLAHASTNLSFDT
jgi:hypothetical protein